MGFKFGSIYINKNTNPKIKIVGKSYLSARVSRNIHRKHITFKDYSEGFELSYSELKKNWTLSIGDVLKDL